VRGEYVIYITGGQVVEHPHDPGDIMGAAGAWPFAYISLDEPIDGFIHHLRAHHICIAYGDWQYHVRELADLLDVRTI
jgi:L-fucose isomerase-like protein